MAVIQSFWSPCWCYNDLRHGCIAVAVYTVLFSIMSIVYSAWVIAGGQSSDLYSPFFETDVRTSAPYAGGAIIIFCLIFIVTAVILLFGVINENRAALFPWMFVMAFLILILFGTAFGIWLIARYYIDARSVLCAVFIWCFTGFNIYCFLCVWSENSILKSYQRKSIIKLRT